MEGQRVEFISKQLIESPDHLVVLLLLQSDGLKHGLALLQKFLALCGLILDLIMCTKPGELLLQSFVLINSYKAQHSIIKIPLIIEPVVHDRLHPYCYISNLLLHHLLTSFDHSFNLTKNRVRLLHGFLDLSLTRLYRA